MSAWIVTKSHIDALVTQAIAEGIVNPDKADTVGLMLWAENYHSVNIRYRENTPVPEYHYEAPGFALDPRKVDALIDCWDYQCMEWSGYDREPGNLLMQELQARILEKHPKLPRPKPWGIDSLEEVRADADVQ